MSTMELSKNTLLAMRGNQSKTEQLRQPSGSSTPTFYPTVRRAISTGKVGSSAKPSLAVVPFLLKTVTAPTIEAKSPSPYRLGEELVAVQKAAKVINAAVEDGTITAREADAVFSLLSENFAARRINKVFERIADSHRSHQWFFTTRLSSTDE